MVIALPSARETDDLEVALWADVCLAADLLVLFVSIGQLRNAGIVVKGQAGPVRDMWMNRLSNALPADVAIRTIPVGVSTDRLMGGLDLSGTLAAGRTVSTRGLLSQADGQLILLPMADLREPETLSQITATLDSETIRIERDGVSRSEPTRFGIVAFDESATGDDGVSRMVTDRMTLHIDLSDISIRAAGHSVEEANEPSSGATISDEQRTSLCKLAAAFGLMSLRPAMQAVEVAKAHCMIRGQSEVGEEDVAAAVRLGLFHRAERIPVPPQDSRADQKHEEQAAREETETPDEKAGETETAGKIPEDILLHALASSLPGGLLDQLKSRLERRSSRTSGGRRGARQRSAKRGRPLASRKGELRSGKRLDLMATLRSAAPWQRLRRQQPNNDRQIHIRPVDFCIRRYRQRSESSVIFVVDASGSTALNRLAEAKGAIELLLGESYARRDHVALVSFRGREAEVLLSPTRALARARRSLAALPGGGGTPLASGLQTALMLAEDESRRGREPSIILMTDGSANIDAGGVGGRKQAADDAENAARGIGASDFRSILIDVGRQSRPAARKLSGLMNAAYVPMPFASSKNISDAVRAGLQ